jgi:hypothetical protein
VGYGVALSAVDECGVSNLLYVYDLIGSEGDVGHVFIIGCIQTIDNYLFITNWSCTYSYAYYIIISPIQI